MTLGTQPLPGLGQPPTPVPWAGGVTPRLPTPITRPPPITRPGGLGVPSVAPAALVTPPVPEPEIKKAEEVLPFWQRALQVFAMPFVWADENIIEPGLALTGTTLGFVPEVTRNPGEDFWEWKKRAWAGWDAPGFNFNVPWSEEPWRMDLKGVMEIAPWLLIPGVGQVGRGAKAARGLTGKLGALETVGQKTSLAGAFEAIAPVGRKLGYVIEYSPWGLAEKAAGKVIKGGVKSIGFISGRVSAAAGEKLFGKIPPPPPPTIAEIKLTKYFVEAVMPAFGKVQRLIPEELRPNQIAIIEKYRTLFSEGKISRTERRKLTNIGLEELGGVKAELALTPEALASRQMKDIAKIEARVVSGELDKEVGKALITKIKKSPEFTAVSFNERELTEFISKIEKAEQDGFIAMNSTNAMDDLLILGLIPEPRFIKQWAEIFGREFGESVNKFIKLKPSVRARILDGLNLPRAVLATLDLSATFRQGLILGLTRPQDVPRAFWRQLKYFGSEKLSLQMDDMLRSRVLYPEATKAGVEFQAIRRGAAPRMKEEPFLSNLATHIPFVRRSERAFTGYLNEMRMGAFEAGHGAMVAQGASTGQFKLLGDFINYASGRGTLPFNLTKYAPLLNAILFSPRYQISTLGLPKIIGRMLLSKNPYLRKQGGLALATFVGGGITVLGLLKSTGVAEVETDPRAGDFGKIKIGETRLDIWRGYIQYARFATQMLMGERKSAYGNINEAERWDIAVRFAQTKFSPAAGLIADLWKGENYLGEPLFEGTTGFSKTARDRLLPLAIQDVIDAIEMDGANGIWKAIPATLGIGVLTFVNDLNRIQQRVAREMGFEGWDVIDPKTRREIENSNVELQAAQIAFDRQTMGFAWSDWSSAAKAIDGVFRSNIDLAVAEYQKTGDGYLFREKVSKAYDARKGGYQARDKELRFEDIVRRLNVQDTVEANIALGPEQLAIRIYNDRLWSDDMYDEFGNYKYEEADIRKEELLQSMGQDMFTYVEDYRALRYEDYPPEFQELRKARIALKPYWEVAEDADRYFGLIDSPRKNAFISRHRKRLKRTNPLMAYYLDIFYTRS